ncbi:MAG: fluoride efflux transporter CrcB [Bacillaceae bacterium]|nr:fluoride efflux transporter CrcB [Bacillaceae bacterium]
MILSIAVGGGLGALARFYLSSWLNSKIFPLGTWIANISGSILLGLLMVTYLKGILTEGWWGFLGVGFCGAYTTFSTFGLETVQMIADNQWAKAISYVASTVLISFLFAALILLFI